MNAEKFRYYAGGLLLSISAVIISVGGFTLYGTAPGENPDLVQVTAPANIEVGQLTIIDASKSTAKTFKWIVTPDTANFLVIENGQKAVFSEGRAGDYRFYIAGAAGDEVDADTLTITVGDPPTPTPDTIAAKVRKWVAGVSSPSKASEKLALGASFNGVAAQIAAGVLKTPDDVIKSTAVANRGALGSSLEAWRPFADSLRKELNALSESGQLTTLEQHAAVWRQIGNALEEKDTK